MSAAAVPAFGTAELRAGDTRVVIVPALGGKLASLQVAGREWLWYDPVSGTSPPASGGAFTDAMVGGYDECFPTAARCSLPPSAGRYGGLALPDHGELWSQPTTFSLETREEGMYAACGWSGTRMPYRFARGVFVGREHRVEMRYAVTNDGRAPLPYIWSAHPLLPLSRETRVVLPDGARVRVAEQRGVDLGGVGIEHRWPRMAARGRALDLSVPYAAGRSYAVKVFVDVPAGSAAIEEAGARLDVFFDPAQVPGVGLWIDRRGQGLLRGRRAPALLSLQPAIGAPDSLADALGAAWRSARWLEPGETREWTLIWQGSRLVHP